MLFGSSPQFARLDHVSSVTVLSSRLPIVEVAHGLGVVVDSRLAMSAHVCVVCRGSFYQMRQLRPVIDSLSMNPKSTVVQVFISSRLDYCNTSVFPGITSNQLMLLQSA